MKELHYPINDTLESLKRHSSLISLKGTQDNNISLSYISDLHIDHYLAKKHGDNLELNKVRHSIVDIIKTIEKDFSNSHSSFLLIGGDISDNFELTKLFYSLLVKAIKPQKIIVVLGNHELWDESITSFCLISKLNVYDVMIKSYEKLFSELGITFLNNNIVGVKLGYFANANGKYIYHEDSILPINSDIINKYDNYRFREFFDDIAFFIFGGIGFSANNIHFNAIHGLYNQAIKDIDEDRFYTDKFTSFYQKIERLLGNTTTIVLTHTPAEDWINKEFNHHWIYLNGHTHHNIVVRDSNRTIIADNQAGYNATSYHLKHFFIDQEYDRFSEHLDGIHVINKETYGCNRSYIDYIYMLKKDGMSCFIGVNTNKSRLYFMNGLNPMTLYEDNPIEYYYDNMSKYSSLIDAYIHDFSKYLNNVSKFVKSFGGNGYIHGCIVDIDYWNHLYVNPIDYKVTPYYANSIVDKYIFKNIPSLLKYQAPSLFKKYMKNKIDLANNSLIKWSDQTLMISKDKQYYPDTTMYKYSRIMRALQYKEQKNIIRIWFEEFTGKEKTSDLLESISIIKAFLG